MKNIILMVVAVLCFSSNAYANDFTGVWSHSSGTDATLQINRMGNSGYSTYGVSTLTWTGLGYINEAGQLMETYTLITPGYSYTGFQVWSVINENTIQYISYDKNGENVGSGYYNRVIQ